MKYDFASIMDRRGQDAVAIDAVGHFGDVMPTPKEGFDPIPMWIADMNFPTCPTVIDALVSRAQQPHFGYFFNPREEYFSEIIQWHEKRYGVTGLTKECIGYENGVVGGVVGAVNALCTKGDKILIHSPTYMGFINNLTKNGYHLVNSPMVLDDQGVWRMDFEDMEQKIVANNIHTTVLCSPHNPCGRVWERWELEKAMEIFKKHDVYVVSDEIWSDFVFKGRKHIPTQSVSEDARNRTVALYSPTKTFNLASLYTSYHIIYNKWLRDQVCKDEDLSCYNKMNVLSMHALIGAYKPEGYEWVDELCEVLSGNVDLAHDYIVNRFEGVTAAKPEGTYMLFLDCTEWCAKHGKTLDELLSAGWEVGVEWQDGRAFNGPCHIRMNLALPLSRVQEAFDRLDKYVFNA